MQNNTYGKENKKSDIELTLDDFVNCRQQQSTKYLKMHGKDEFETAVLQGKMNIEHVCIWMHDYKGVPNKKKLSLMVILKKNSDHRS